MNEDLRAELLRRVAADHAWPPDVADTRTATCPECGQEVTFRTAG